MRLVYLNPSGQVGGAEAVLLDVLASVRAAHPEWSIQLIVSDRGPLVSRATGLGVPTMILPFPARLARLGDSGLIGGRIGRWLVPLVGLLLASRASATYVRELRSALAELAPDLLQTNGLKMHLLGSWARPYGVPVIWHVHDYIQSRPIMARLLKISASRSAAIVANSESVRKDAQSVVGNRVRTFCIYNGLDLDRFSPFGPVLDLDVLAGLPSADPRTVRVGLVGTFARWKGHTVFLRAISLLSRDVPVRAYVIGNAIYQTKGSQYTIKELQGLARELGIANKVGFTGYVQEPASAMRALDIVVHASTRPEPFGLVIAEAMACGRAVVVSHAGGAGEVVSPPSDALTHAPGDAEALARSIERLALDAELRASLGVVARANAVRRFDRTRLGNEFSSIYSEVAEDRSVGSRNN